MDMKFDEKKRMCSCTIETLKMGSVDCLLQFYDEVIAYFVESKELSNDYELQEIHVPVLFGDD